MPQVAPGRLGRALDLRLPGGLGEKLSFIIPGAGSEAAILWN